jgi:hypothetical protein
MMNVIRLILALVHELVVLWGAFFFGPMLDIQFNGGVWFSWPYIITVAIWLLLGFLWLTDKAEDAIW